jgi:hypothetical protein
MGVLRPAGPLPARVYWFRRFVVVGIPLVIVAVVVWVLLGRGDGASPDDTAQEPGTSETPAGDGTTTDETTGPEACAVEALGLTLTADAASYAPGALPTLTVSLVNNGTVDCLVDAGEAQREILIVSGEDRIWSTRDCAAEDTLARELLLVPGTPDVTTVQWARVRSAVGCPTDEVDAQPGTYSATLSLAGVTPPPAVFVLE